MSHKMTHLQVGNSQPFKHAARCKCGQYSGPLDQKWEVDDWVREHHAKIEVIKAYLGTKTPTLKSQRDYYLMMSENPEVVASDREMWKLLADELGKRVNDGPAVWVQDQLL